MLRLRNLREYVVDLPRVHLPLLQRCVRGGRGYRDDDALILLRRELAARAAIEEIDTPQHQEAEHDCGRQIGEAAARCRR